MFLAGCKRSDNENGFSNVRQKIQSPDIKYRELKIEKIELDSVYCSYEGFSGVGPDNRLYYLDRYFGYCYFFSPDGKLVDRKLGLGRSDKETMLRQAIGNAFSDTGDMVLMGSNLDFEIFDKDIRLKKRFNIPYSPAKNPEDFCTYSFAWDSFVCRMSGGKIYVGMSSENPSFNYFDTSEAYLEHGRHIGCIDTESGTASMLLEGFPDIYHKEKDRAASSRYVNFDISRDGVLYTGFEADSLIYECTLSGTPERAFGNAGIGMDTDYRPVNSWDDMDLYRDDRIGKGRFGWIEYVDETGILFRSYKKSDNTPDGLQIYSDGVLVGDTDVPVGMRVVGYIHPYYYSQIYEDDENGRLYIFRFRL